MCHTVSRETKLKGAKEETVHCFWGANMIDYMAVNGKTLVRGHILEYDPWDVQIKIKL